jgi:hypothetical protein
VNWRRPISCTRAFATSSGVPETSDCTVGFASGGAEAQAVRKTARDKIQIKRFARMMHSCFCLLQKVYAQNYVSATLLAA